MIKHPLPWPHHFTKRGGWGQYN